MSGHGMAAGHATSQSPSSSPSPHPAIIYIYYYNTLYKMHVAELSADPGQRKGERVRAERL